MKILKIFKNLFYGLFIVFFALSLLSSNVVAKQDHPNKVTICHAAGQDGTLKYVTLTLGWNAVYGQAGHFYENGTPRAGHENDYLGACIGDTPTPTYTPTSTPTDITITPTVTVTPTDITITPTVTGTPTDATLTSTPQQRLPQTGADGRMGSYSTTFFFLSLISLGVGLILNGTEKAIKI